jgi:hypothetical protein
LFAAAGRSRGEAVERDRLNERHPS